MTPHRPPEPTVPTPDRRTEGEQAQRVAATSGEFFVRFLHAWLVFTTVLTMVQIATLGNGQGYAGAGGLTLGLLARWFVHLGRLRAARRTFIFGLSAFVFAVPWFVNGVTTPIIANQLVILVMASWLLGLGSMRVLAGLFVADLAALWLVERMAWWTPPVPPRGINVWLMAWVAQVVMVWLSTHALIRGFRSSLSREAKLQEQLNAALEKAQASADQLEAASRSANLSLAAVESANDELATVVRFNEAILLNSPLPMAVYTGDGRCVQANEAYATLVGTTRDGILRTNFRLRDSWRDSGLLAQGEAALADGQPRRHTVHLTTSFGREIHAEYRLLPIELHRRPHLLVQFMDLTEHKRLESQLREMAFHDALTGLPNRRLFLDRLHHALQLGRRTGQHGALLYLDLNRFKQLNDAHGHDAGDQLLAEVARRLRQMVRDSDTVARLGGDEFVVLLEELGAAAADADAAARAVADKIARALAEPYVLGTLRHEGSASIGLRVLHPADQDPDAVLSEADAEMYRQKKSRQA